MSDNLILLSFAILDYKIKYITVSQLQTHSFLFCSVLNRDYSDSISQTFLPIDYLLCCYQRHKKEVKSKRKGEKHSFYFSSSGQDCQQQLFWSSPQLFSELPAPTWKSLSQQLAAFRGAPSEKSKLQLTTNGKINKNENERPVPK